MTNSYLTSLRESKNEPQDNLPNQETNNTLSWLTSRTNLHLILITIGLLVSIGNIQARDKGQSDPASKTILFSMLGNEEEELIEESSLLVGNQANTLANEISLSLRTDQLALNNESAETQDGLEQVEVLQPDNESGALVQPTISTTSSSETRTEITDYTVQEGDVLGAIAEKFGVSISTILWENNLSMRSVIKPGQSLTILPTTGITHDVENGDTISEIAATYRADAGKIIEYNNLTDASDIKINQTLIIPGGKKPDPVYTNPTPSYASNSGSTYSQQISYSNTPTDQELYNQRIYSRPSSAYGSHRFPWGQCTWYVAQRRYVPWAGHAKQWIGNARAYGYSIGNSPKVGAIIVTRESWYGHVGYVESVGNGTVTFAESNYKGLGVITRRTLNVNDRRILGYIY